jgi:spore germination cell wall hydrolase CwlJ-like protein
MSASRSGPRGADVASFGLAGLFFFLTSTQVGYQDLAALVAPQPTVPARLREHKIASPFGTIHDATFNLPQPVGTAIPEMPKIRLASLDPSEDVVGSINGNPFSGRTGEPRIAPTINRARKGDRLVPAGSEAEAASKPESQPTSAQADAASDEFPEVQDDLLAAIERDARKRAEPATRPDEIEAEMRYVPFPEYDISLSLELRPRIAVEEPIEVAKLDPADLYPTAPPSLEGLNAEVKAERLYFGNDLFGTSLGAIEPWAVGEEPILLMPRAPADPKPFDAKPAAPVAALPAAPAVAQPATPAPDAGITVAAKGEVTGDEQRPQTPADRLGLTGEKRAKAANCLAKAIYFEAGIEPVRGQIAVAQVVMNRAFSGYYPNDVCGVVFQNVHRFLACQFTFACNGKPLIASSQMMWTRAMRIAEETLDGKLWLPEIGKATHYHADYVHPWWARTMNKHAKIGLHIFYRPRLWGDGADRPSWGSPTYTTEAAAKM